jgi:hypothetical protein
MIEPSRENRKMLTDVMASNFHRMYQQSEIKEIKENTILSVYSGIRMTYLFSLFKGQDDGKSKEFKCVSKIYTIFAHQLADTIGFAHPIEGPYQKSEDLIEIERSIHIM